jgi:hypothetical protein
MLVSAGQLPPTEQADFAAAPQIPKVQTKESEPLPTSDVPPPSKEEVEAPTTELRNDGQFNPSPSEVILNKETDHDTPPPSTTDAVESLPPPKPIIPEATVPDDVVRAARAAPRLVPPFAAEENIAVEEGRLAEEVVVGVPKSRFVRVDEFVNQ